jgi:glucose-6-phosphate 1-dehydrogenase
MRQPFGKLLLFGATGDLSQRMLIPSLYGLHADGLLPQDLTITGTARSTLSDAEFRDFAAKALDTHLPEDRKDAGAIAAFLDRLQYQQLDASDLGGYAALAEKLGDISNGLAIFLSTAPKFFEPTIKGLASAGLAGSNVRIGLEKPLGTDLPTSREINDAVASVFPEERTFRIDHYLGKERSRTSSRCASAIRCSSRSGTPPGSTMSRSPSPKRSGSRVARAIMTRSARCAIWSRTISCNCSR